jgi:hypothetical protein
METRPPTNGKCGKEIEKEVEECFAIHIYDQNELIEKVEKDNIVRDHFVRVRTSNSHCT